MPYMPQPGLVDDGIHNYKTLFVGYGRLYGRVKIDLEPILRTVYNGKQLAGYCNSCLNMMKRIAPNFIKDRFMLAPCRILLKSSDNLHQLVFSLIEV